MSKKKHLKKRVFSLDGELQICEDLPTSLSDDDTIIDNASSATSTP